MVTHNLYRYSTMTSDQQLIAIVFDKLIDKHVMTRNWCGNVDFAVTEKIL